MSINLFIKANNTLLVIVIPGVTGSSTDIFLSNFKVPRDVGST